MRRARAERLRAEGASSAADSAFAAVGEGEGQGQEQVANTLLSQVRWAHNALRFVSIFSTDIRNTSLFLSHPHDPIHALHLTIFLFVHQ